MKKYDEYIVFILGTDNFKLSKFIEDRLHLYITEQDLL